VAVPNKIKNMELLDRRPAEVTERRTPGHWEGDPIIGRKMTSAIGTLVERITKYVVLIHLPHGYKAPQLRDAMISQTRVIPAAMRKTLTWDQGREMALHEQITTGTGFDVFFCDPHSPWQRGLNENTNGLLRQYFPKSTDLSAQSTPPATSGASPVNSTTAPGTRHTLGDRTPQEAMRDLLASSTN
jgi:IS30 family transposase